MDTPPKRDIAGRIAYDYIINNATDSSALRLMTR
jgi:hypothetical protein